MESLSLASNSRRVWSYAIDDIVMSMFFIVIFFDQLSAITTPEDATMFVTQNYWVLVILKMIYHTLFTWQSGKTFGKQLMKIKSVDINSNELLTLSMSFVRSFVRILDEAVFYVGFLPAFFSGTRQTMHDRISRSIVINV